MDQIGTAVKHTQNLPDSGADLDIFILPDDVSFSEITFRELDVAGVPTAGYFHCNTFSGGHCPPAGLGPCAGEIGMLTTVVSGKGTQASGHDCAYSGDCGGTPPFTPGSISLAIPYEYKVGSGAFRRFATVNQVHALAADASTCTTSKAGATVSTTVTAPSVSITACP
jgi:hypothetical protein